MSLSPRYFISKEKKSFIYFCLIFRFFLSFFHSFIYFYLFFSFFYVFLWFYSFFHLLTTPLTSQYNYFVSIFNIVNITTTFTNMMKPTHFFTFFMSRVIVLHYFRELWKNRFMSHQKKNRQEHSEYYNILPLFCCFCIVFLIFFNHIWRGHNWE